MLDGTCCLHNAWNTKAMYTGSFCHSMTCVAQCLSVCRASNLAEARCILFSSAGRIACKDVGLFEAFSCPRPPSPPFDTLLYIERHAL